jgi:hypothetical protein
VIQTTTPPPVHIQAHTATNPPLPTTSHSPLYSLVIASGRPLVWSGGVRDKLQAARSDRVTSGLHAEGKVNRVYLEHKAKRVYLIMPTRSRF